MTNKNFRKQLPRLRRLRHNKTFSPALKTAIDELIVAIDTGDLGKAAAISAVKSYICGGIPQDQNKNHFYEKGMIAYHYLDSLHFDLAMALDEMPSGFSEIRATQDDAEVRTRPKSTLRSPTIDLINAEHQAIIDDIKNRDQNK